MNGKKDLYSQIGVEILNGDRVRFRLNSGLEIITNESFSTLNIEVKRTSKKRRTLIGVITHYNEDVRGDYEIKGYTTKGYTFRLRLANCYDIKRVKPN